MRTKPISQKTNCHSGYGAGEGTTEYYEYSALVEKGEKLRSMIIFLDLESMMCICSAKSAEKLTSSIHLWALGIGE